MSHARETLYSGILHVYVSRDTMDNSGMIEKVAMFKRESL